MIQNLSSKDKDRITVNQLESKGGKSITIGPQAKIDFPQLSSEELDKIQSENKLSNKQIFGVARNMRLKFGRKVTEPYSREKMTRRNNDIIELFELVTEEFEAESNIMKKYPLVFCKNIPSLVDKALKKRDLHLYEVHLKIGIDFGKGHLRVTLTVWNPEEVLSGNGGARRKRSEGIGGSSKSLQGGDRVLIIASSPEVKESYNNFKVIFNHNRPSITGTTPILRG